MTRKSPGKTPGWWHFSARLSRRKKPRERAKREPSATRADDAVNEEQRDAVDSLDTANSGDTTSADATPLSPTPTESAPPSASAPSAKDDPTAPPSDPSEAAPNSTDASELVKVDPEIPDRLLHMRWDMDKTYLLTEFDTLRDLYRTFTQRAEDKVAIAGASMLLKQLMNEHDGIRRRVTFISGSPRQMRKVLTRKLNLDGIEPDVFILKPNLSNLLRGRFRAIRGQVGYKLKALLHSHMIAVEVDEFLFGDDSEQDAFIYSVYADILNGRLDATALLAILNVCKVYRRDTTEIMAMHSKLYSSGDAVKRIFIHLEARSPLDRFEPYGARVVAIYNYFQAALLLFEASVLPAPGLLTVIDAMADSGYTPVRLANSLQDLLRRGVLDVATAKDMSTALANAEHVRGYRATRFTRRFEEVVAELRLKDVRPPPNPPTITEINYLGLYHAARFRRERYRLINTGIRILD
jgi:hypothetical protein